MHYTLLKPTTTRQPRVFIFDTTAAIDFSKIPSDVPIALDFEMTGLDPRAPGAAITAASFSWQHDQAYAVHLDEHSTDFWDWAAGHKGGFIFHNAVFDMMWAQASVGVTLPLKACTLTMFRAIANEGVPGQAYGLKTAMTNLLGWDADNTDELSAWLETNDLKKKDMHKAPWSILGKYAALDAGATFQLYHFFIDQLTKVPVGETLYDYIHNDLVVLTNLVVEQNKYGILVDKEQLDNYRDQLQAEIDSWAAKFVAIPEVATGISAYNEKYMEDFRRTEPTAKMTKAGVETANYTKWKQKLAERAIENHFNIDSPSQLQWLLYTHMGLKSIKGTEKGANSVDKSTLKTLGEPGKILAEYRIVRDILKFVTAVGNLSEESGKIFPLYNIYGTLSGRCSGGLKR